MALTGQEKLILVAILAAVMIAVVFFELRVMRRKSKEIRLASQRKDEAYNDILTTRSVLNSLRNQGKDTGNAEEFLDRAKSAMNRGEYERSVDLCTKARNQLTKPGGVVVEDDAALDEEADRLEEVAEEILSEGLAPADASSYKGTKLATSADGNYLGAKFEMSKAKSEISRAAKSGLDVSSAETLMVQAESEFKGGKYDKALSCAVRARKAIVDDVGEDAIPLKAGEEGEATEPKVEPGVYDVEDEKTPSGVPCPECETLNDPTDAFCGSCGAKLVKDRTCRACGAKGKPDDAFCRKCGAKIP